MKIKRRTAQAEVPSMAMGDIAFNLLIFFVILAKVTDDGHVQWQPARLNENLQSAGFTKVSLVIDKDEDLYFNGRQISVSQLESLLILHFEDALPDDRKVVLKVHHDATANRFEPVIEAVSKAGGVLYHIVEEESGID